MKQYHPEQAIMFLINEIKSHSSSFRGGNGKGLTALQCGKLLDQWDTIRRKEDE